MGVAVPSGGTVRPWLAVVAAGLLLAGCGGDTGTGTGAQAPAGGAQAASRAGGRQPEGTGPEAVSPYIEALLARYDAAANQIVADPSVARHTDHPLIREVTDLFEPGSDDAAALIGSWTLRAGAGESMRPISHEHPVAVTRLDGAVATVSRDEVTFPTCDLLYFEVLGDRGVVIEQARGLEEPGEGIAVRVGGEWRLRQLAVLGGRSGCRTEGP